MIIKRQPLIIDHLLAGDLDSGASGAFLSRRTRDMLRAELIEAKRFVLDAQASRWCGEMIAAVPEAIVHGQEFAIPPFPLTYIEIDAVPFWEGMNYPEPETANTMDKRLGLLYAGPSVYTCVTDATNRAAVMPIKYTLNVPMTHDEEMNLAYSMGVSRAQLDVFMWGHYYNQVPKEMQRAFRANHGAHIIDKVKGVWDNEESRQRLGASLYMNCMGDLRNVIALLLFLNQTRDVQYVDEVPHARGMLRNRAGTMLRHSVVRLRLNPVPRLIKRFAQLRSAHTRREHDVRGHLCHNKRSHNGWCSHQWEEHGVHRWHCIVPGCGAMRWWRSAHRRGKAKIGTVVASYEVTK